MEPERATFGEQFAVIQEKKMLEESRRPKPPKPREVLDNAAGQKRLRNGLDDVYIEPV